MANERKKAGFAIVVVVGAVLAVLTAAGAARGAGVPLVKGQKIYVPVYSHIFHGDKERPFELAVTLSVRNTDPEHAVSLVSVDYYDSEGKLVKRYLENGTKLNPLAAAHFVVKESDKSGGAGASFIVRWKSDAKVTEPIVEAVMIGTSTQQGISFSSRGRVIAEEVD